MQAAVCGECGECGAVWWWRSGGHGHRGFSAAATWSSSALVCAFDPEQSQICADQKKTLLS